MEAFTSGAKGGFMGAVQGRQADPPMVPEKREESVAEPASREPEVEQATEVPAVVSTSKPVLSAYQKARQQLDQKLEARGLNDPVRSQEIDFSR